MLRLVLPAARHLAPSVGLLLVATLASAQALTLRVDLAAVSAFTLYYPALLMADGYGVRYRFEAPRQQEFSFGRATPTAEFDEIEVSLTAEIDEVRTSKAGEPAALIIRPGQTGPVAFWDLPASGAIPPAPPADEVRRRLALADSLVSKMQEALGLKGFQGGDSGTASLPLSGVEDLTLRSRGAPAQYAYSIFAVLQPPMAEELEAERATATLTVTVEADRVVVKRETPVSGGSGTVTEELIVERERWEGVRETRRPAERPSTAALVRDEAERLLAEALQELRLARQHFGITFGRDVSAIRLP